MLEKVFKVLQIIIAGVLILIIGICLIFIGKRIINKDEPTNMFGYYFFEVEAYSMWPEIDYGDLVIDRKPKNGEYEVGMIVTYKASDGATVTHRIVRIEDDMIICQGISHNNESEDSPITSDMIYGEVVSIWRNYRGFINFVKSPIGIILIVITAGLIFGGVPLMKLVFKKEE